MWTPITTSGMYDRIADYAQVTRRHCYLGNYRVGELHVSVLQQMQRGQEAAQTCMSSKRLKETCHAVYKSQCNR